MPGFRESFDYRMQVETPTGKVVNYADGGEGTASSPYHFFMARQFGAPGYAAFALTSLSRDLAAIESGENPVTIAVRFARQDSGIRTVEQRPLTAWR